MKSATVKAIRYLTAAYKVVGAADTKASSVRRWLLNQPNVQKRLIAYSRGEIDQATRWTSNLSKATTLMDAASANKTFRQAKRLLDDGKFAELYAIAAPGYGPFWDVNFMHSIGSCEKLNSAITLLSLIERENPEDEKALKVAVDTGLVRKPEIRHLRDKLQTWNP